MSRDREYCSQPVPDALRRFSGECCVLSKGHKDSHRSLGIGNRDTGDGPKTWPNTDPTQVMVKDVRRIVRKAGLPAPQRYATRNWSEITRHGAVVDRWGDQIVRVLWVDGALGGGPVGQALLRQAAKALLDAGYRVHAKGGILVVSHRVLTNYELGEY